MVRSCSMTTTPSTASESGVTKRSTIFSVPNRGTPRSTRYSLIADPRPHHLLDQRQQDRAERQEIGQALLQQDGAAAAEKDLRRQIDFQNEAIDADRQDRMRQGIEQQRRVGMQSRLDMRGLVGFGAQKHRIVRRGRKSGSSHAVPATDSASSSMASSASTSVGSSLVTRRARNAAASCRRDPAA